MSDDILDPTHAGDDDGGSTAVVAGLANNTNDKSPDEKPGPAAKLTPDGNIAEIDGKKYVTEAALANERATNRQLRETIAALEPHMADFEQFLQSKQRPSKPAPVIDSGITDEEDYLRDVAVSLGFTDADGEPDLRKAQAHVNIVRRETSRVVEPVARGSREERARQHREKALSAQYVDGKPVASEKYMTEALNSLGPDQLADPQVANMAQVIAAGLEYLDLRRTGGLSRGNKRGEPNFREGTRGRFEGDVDGEMSALDLAAARARGKSPEEWAKMQRRVSGRDNRNDVLENL